MTITTHTRVQRGYYRRYYERTVEIRREKARESRKCRYRLGCALQLLEELRVHWEHERLSTIRLTPPSLTIFEEWTTCASDGRNNASIGKSVLRIRSTG